MKTEIPIIGEVGRLYDLRVNDYIIFKNNILSRVEEVNTDDGYYKISFENGFTAGYHKDGSFHWGENKKIQDQLERAGFSIKLMFRATIRSIK